MLYFLFTAAIVVWVLARSRLWRLLVNVRREIRASLRRGSFAQYYVAVRWRELAGLMGFGLAALAVADADARSYAALHGWARVLLWSLVAGVALYILYVIVDGARLRRRFRRLLARRHRYI